jgi:glycosidase
MCNFNTLFNDRYQYCNMKGFLTTVCLIAYSFSFGQLLTWSPDFISENSLSVEIIVDASRGNQGLNNYAATGDVYIHTGVITSSSNSANDWKYVKFPSFNTPNPQAQAVYLGNNKWKFTISGGLRTFFGLTNNSEKILKIALLFRSGNGSVVQRNADGSDMFIPVYEAGLSIRLSQPPMQPMFIPAPEPIIKSIGESISVTANASLSANMKLSLNGVQIATQNGVLSITSNPVITTGGLQVILAEASDGINTRMDSVRFFVSAPPPVAPVPAGLRDGINYEAGDTSAILVFYAPAKNSVFVLGDFNNWTQAQNYQMTNTPDGNRHWIRITGLNPGTEYAYQFLVDATLKVADYYTEKVLDQFNDPYISPLTYPGLKAYPIGKTTGIVSILQTKKPAFNWQVGNFSRPDKRNLLVYELLVRDFTGNSNLQTLKDTLSYIKRLGINVVELMPVNEFEGNNSWGYNPSFYFAPDKYYGTESDLRRFIDACHQQGIAVVLDIALNHSFGQSPMVQLYYDGASGKPAANSPWFNTDPKHPFNVGYDFNHETAATKDFVDRVVEHWLVNYKIDGFRWDLSKGFTQVNNPNNVAAWGAYDPTRIAIWKRIYDKMQAVAPGSYCILEHFADNSEEIELSDYGMLLWGNSNFNFNEATMGFVANSNFDGSIAKKRNWNKPYLIAYQESHDEERLMFKNITFGNSSNTSHNAKNLQVALSRNAMAAAFWAMMPGPKMLWQFGELGYDYSITYCPSTGTVPQPYPSSQCRTDPKPIRWEYQLDLDRKNLYNVYAALLQLRTTPNYISTFTTNTDVSWDMGTGFKWLKTESDSLRVVVIGNFDVTSKSGNVVFPSAGTWYSYLSQGTRTATGGSESITLQPGEFYVYTNRNISNPVITGLEDLRPDYSNQSLIIYPNPVVSSATLAYEIPITGKVDISIYNIQGQKMVTLFNGIKPRGKHAFTWNASESWAQKASNGQYLLVMDIEGRKMKKQFLISR